MTNLSEFGVLERVESHVRVGVDQFGPCGARDHVPTFPHADVDGWKAQSGGNLCCALGGDDVGVGHEPHVTRSYAVLSSSRLHTVTCWGVTSRHMETQWALLDEPHERLRWARMHWQESRGIKPDAGLAAESMGIKPHTYRAYERPEDASKHSALSHQRAIQFGRKFGVSWTWLMEGKGTPFDIPTNELNETERRIVEAVRDVPEERQASVAAAIEALLKSQAA